MNQSIETAITSYFSQWLGNHPYLAWTISHPLPSIGLLLLLAFILGGLFRAIGGVFEQTWIFLLKTPFKLLQPIFQGLWRSIEQIFGHNNLSGWKITKKPDHSLPIQRRAQILDRLQTLNQEQNLLLQELSSLADEKSVPSDTQ